MTGRPRGKREPRGKRDKAVASPETHFARKRANSLLIENNSVLSSYREFAGRSFDRTMPEEINRIVTDSIADLLWTPSPDADTNLLHEGIPKSKVERVGNIMIDAFEMLRSDIATADWPSKHGFTNRPYGVVTCIDQQM